MTDTKNTPPQPNVEWGDWTVDDTDTAREIMNYLGYGSDASREPGADRRRDKIAAMIRARIDAASAPAPSSHVAVEDEIARVVQSVNEWDDRTSPDDYPEHLLITSEELADILRKFAETLATSEASR